MTAHSNDGDIYYQCQRCGNCCRWHGDVRITDQETVRIAEFFGMEVEDFVAEYTRLNANRTGLSLIEQLDGACIFLEGIDCTIQPVKPSQCKGFPNTWNFPGWRKHCEAIPVPFRKPRPGPCPPPNPARYPKVHPGHRHPPGPETQC